MSALPTDLMQCIGRRPSDGSEPTWCLQHGAPWGHLDELALCDGRCGEWHNDVAECFCGLVRCTSCREEGCPRCGAHWTDNYWPGGRDG